MAHVPRGTMSQSASLGQEVRPLVVTTALFRVVELPNPHLKEPSRKSRILTVIVAIFILAGLFTISIILPLKKFSPKKSPPVEAAIFPPTTIANQKFVRLSRWELRNDTHPIIKAEGASLADNVHLRLRPQWNS